MNHSGRPAERINVCGMLDVWLKEALARSGLTQAELARSLSRLLGRSITRGAVNKMLSGKRNMLADEMIYISRMCNYPLPEAREHEVRVYHSKIVDSFVLRCRSSYLRRAVVETLAEAEVSCDHDEIAQLLLQNIVRSNASNRARTYKDSVDITFLMLESMAETYLNVKAEIDEAFNQYAQVIIRTMEEELEAAGDIVSISERAKLLSNVKKAETFGAEIEAVRTAVDETQESLSILELLQRASKDIRRKR